MNKPWWYIPSHWIITVKHDCWGMMSFSWHNPQNVSYIFQCRQILIPLIRSYSFHTVPLVPILISYHPCWTKKKCVIFHICPDPCSEGPHVNLWHLLYHFWAIEEPPVNVGVSSGILIPKGFAEIQSFHGKCWFCSFDKVL